MNTIVCAFLSFSFLFQGFDESSLSNIDGLSALRQIVGQVSTQEELDIDPDQLDALTDLLNGQRLMTVLASEGVALEAFQSKSKLVDEFVRAEIGKILTPEQVAKRRLVCLKKSFRTPQALFNPKVLSEFGLSAAQITKVQTSTSPRFAELAVEIPKIRKESVTELRKFMDEDSIRRFALLFGGRFIDEAIVPENVDPRELRIFKESSPTFQLRMSRALVLSPPFEITPQQSNSLEKLVRAQAVRIARSPATSFDRDIEREMSSVLRPEQIVALIRATHESCLMSDFSIVSRRESTDFLRLPKDSLQAIDSLAEKSNLSVKEALNKANRNIFEIGVDSMPVELGSRVKVYFKGVWD